MNGSCLLRLAAVWPLLFLAIALAPVRADADPGSARSKAEELRLAGNWKDALDLYRKLLLEEPDDGSATGTDLHGAIECLQRLQRLEETDSLIEASVKAHQGNFRLLREAAAQYRVLPHQGYVVSGGFSRGWARGGGAKYVNTSDRDRVRALQLLETSMPLAAKHGSKEERGSLLMEYAAAVASVEPWQLQVKTDLGSLPDYEEGYSTRYRHRGSQSAAPVDEHGKPILYQTPKNLAAATSDGERWRWALREAASVDPARSDDCDLTFARFLLQQFGSRTLATTPFFRPSDEDDAAGENNAAASVYKLETLRDDEVLARLASGISRFTLPGEFHFIAILKQLSEKQGPLQATALEELASVYEDRRQYERAAEVWARAIELFGKGSGDVRQKRLDQIVGAWGYFEPLRDQASGKNASFEYRFRNGTNVAFTADALKLDLLLHDVEEYLRSNPSSLNWSQTEITNIGYRIVTENQSKYVGERAATWSTALTPREHHFTKRVTVDAPLKSPGVYLLTAHIAGGNTVRCVMWVHDTAIVRKPLKDAVLFYVSDATTGAPAAGMKLEFFGYKEEQVSGSVLSFRSTNVRTKTQAGTTNADGLYTASSGSLDQNYRWLVVARGDSDHDRRLATLGFDSMWYASYYDQEYNETKLYGITDRPVYRPEQTVRFKVWARHAQYDAADERRYADRTALLRIVNPRQEKLEERTIKFDRWGGYEGRIEIPKDAPLGVYAAALDGIGSAFTYRVEEYKKPEFEVTVEAPQAPVALGEQIEAKITAKYYFGAPVTKARVKLKVERSDYSSGWYPFGIWDWFYGPGYWWFAADARWFPGWYEWGCSAPRPWWMWAGPQNPPELVQEQEVEIGADGSLPVRIDTAVAKALHGNTDHQYTITAEVVDDSRRMVAGSGNVLVSRSPFRVYAWVDRGYYRSGDTIHASFLAQTLDQKPVVGTGAAKLFAIRYDEHRNPVETEVQSWSVETPAEARGELQLTAAGAGQYRLVFTVTDRQGRTRDGAYLFTVMGEATRDSEYRFNAVELIPEKREYAPGEKLRLQVNTDRADSTVLLFVRPANGVYLPPQVLRLREKSVVHEIDVTKRDMPNFFVEAVTVRDGEVFTAEREIVVPPEQRVLNVAVEPLATELRPGAESSITLKVTDASGKPFTGTAVVSVYDKSVEYISGGSNVPEIKAFFWKWRRSHQTASETNLMHESAPLLKEGETPMQPIGAFGNSDADGLDLTSVGASSGGGAPRVRKQFARGFSEGVLSDASIPAPASAPMQAQELGAEQYSAKPEAAPPPPPKGAGASPSGAAAAPPALRSEFADTAYWNGNLSLAEDGRSTITFKMPENLTGWKIRVWVLGSGSRVGEGSAEIVTSKKLLLRAQSPRFLVEKDEVVLSANVHNYFDHPKRVEAKIETSEATLHVVSPLSQSREIPAGGEVRVDWRAKAVAEGESTVRMTVLSDVESDAMEVKFPVAVHGMLKTESWSGTVLPGMMESQIALRVPAERRPLQTHLEVRYSPTLAAAMLDALPYLVNYPYGCTEQTLSRFLPTIIVQKTLRDLKIDLKSVREKRTNLNAQEISSAADSAPRWKRYDRDPVFDEAEVQRMARSGLQRLLGMQLSDGGWGWFSGNGETSSPHLSAHVLHGLQVAARAGVDVPHEAVDRGVAYLQSVEAAELQKLHNGRTQTSPYKQHPDALDAFVSYVLSESGQGSAEMRQKLFESRNELAVYAKAMLGLTFAALHDQEKVDALKHNLAQFLVEDEENQTAYLRLGNEGYWWNWYGSEIEAHAYYLKLLAVTEPKSPVAPRLVKYLLNNRKHATYWESTRDTAIVVEAFADFLQATGEAAPDMRVTVLVDGKEQQTVHITKDNLFSFDNGFNLSGPSLTDGEHTVTVRREGTGTVYFNAYLTNFTMEDPIVRAGLEIKVARRYYRLISDKGAQSVAQGSRGQAVTQRVEKFRREPLESGAPLKSGDTVEVELEVESKNDYEYVVLEDFKPAGFEPLEVRSGYNGNDLGAYVEFRDNRVALFVRALPRGKRSVSYRVRAETPGTFSALPARGSAMYAPELRANGDEAKIRVVD